MSSLAISQPLVFHTLYKERIWGGRRLESVYGKQLPAGRKIGESWELVDREDAQSIVAFGPLAGTSLHELWKRNRAELFGSVPDAPRFPLLIKLLDAQEKLSLQVHPPPDAARELDGEPKTEFWYIAEAKPGADLYVGLKKHSSREKIEAALQTGTVEEHVHRIPVRSGDAMFLPSGRMHAIGAGNLIVEIQQNSDTTYRVFDWNRVAETGSPRDLHIAESLRSIDFDDYEPELVKADGESLVRHALFAIDKWHLRTPRLASSHGTFAIIGCLSGTVTCAGASIRAGEFMLIPAAFVSREIEPRAADTSLLRITLPSQ